MDAHGYGAWVGIGLGENEARTHFLEILSEEIKLVQSRVAKPSLRRVSRVNNVPSKKSIEGAMKLQGTFDSIACLLYAALGGCSNSTAPGGAYQYDFTLEDELPFITVEVNRGYTSNFVYSGCKVNKLTLSQPVEDYMEVTAELVGKDEAMASPSTPTFYDPFNGIDWTMATTIEVNGVAVEAKLLEFSVDNGLDSDDYKLGSRVRDDIMRKDHRVVNGKLSVDFDSNGNYELFRNQTNFPIEVIMEGDTITGFTDKNTLRIYLPKCYFSGTTPNVGDPGPVTVEMPFEAFMDSNAAADEIQIKVISGEADLIPT